MFFGVGNSCRILYSIVSGHLYVSCRGLITLVKEDRAYLSAVVYSCNYVVSDRRDFLFLLVLGMGCNILLWHYLCLPYNYCPKIVSKMNHVESFIYDVAFPLINIQVITLLLMSVNIHK